MGRYFLLRTRATSGAGPMLRMMCPSICERKTEDYWWCRDNDQDSSSWDYCSPPGQVRPVQYTMHGHACLGLCDQHGENYWWCPKSRRWAGTDSQAEDEWWDYCSPSKHRTRYNEPCREPCASRATFSVRRRWPLAGASLG